MPARGVASRLEGVTGVFFSGGQQTDIADAIRGTKMHEGLMRLYEEGAVIGGTSAGAAIMTDPMLVAKHEKEAVPFPDDDKYNGVRVIKAGYMHTTGGLGFLPGAIIDQHFLKRMRQNRMFVKEVNQDQQEQLLRCQDGCPPLSGRRPLHIEDRASAVMPESRCTAPYGYAFMDWNFCP